MLPKWFKEEMLKTCPICKNKFYPKEWFSKKRRYCESLVRYSKKKFCGRECRVEFERRKTPEENYFYGKKLVPWNKGKRKDWKIKQASGYIRVIHPDGSFDYEHRELVKAPKGMVVHHIDGNRSNNSLDNLMVLTQQEHVAIHKIERDKNGS